MSRYIDADAIVDKVCEGISCNECSFGTNEDGMSECVLQKRMDGLPTADVRENVHGEWIIDGECIDCSVCRHEKWSRVPFEDLVKGFKFCPNCGADMRGGKK